MLSAAAASGAFAAVRFLGSVHIAVLWWSTYNVGPCFVTTGATGTVVPGVTVTVYSRGW